MTGRSFAAQYLASLDNKEGIPRRLDTLRTHMARLMTQLIGSTSTRLGMLRRCKTSSAAASMAHGHMTNSQQLHCCVTISGVHVAPLTSPTSGRSPAMNISRVTWRACVARRCSYSCSGDRCAHVVLTRTMSLGLAAVIIDSAVCSIVV